MTTLFSIVSFITMIYGMFAVFNISLLEITKNVEGFFNKEKTDIKSKLTTKKKANKGIRSIIRETYSILELMN